MQPRWSQATPQMMQRHTGTAWQQGDGARRKRKPKPAVRTDDDSEHDDPHPPDESKT